MWEGRGMQRRKDGGRRTRLNSVFPRLESHSHCLLPSLSSLSLSLPLSLAFSLSPSRSLSLFLSSSLFLFPLMGCDWVQVY